MRLRSCFHVSRQVFSAGGSVVDMSIDGEARSERLVCVFTAPTPPAIATLASDVNRVA